MFFELDKFINTYQFSFFMNISRLITGIVMISIGLGLSLIPLFISLKNPFISLIYGIPILIIGFFILFNKKEDVVEQIKNRGGKKK